LQLVWAQEWDKAEHGRDLHVIAPTPHKRHQQNHTGLGKAMSSVVIQMRTGKIGLYSYLHGIRAADTDTCIGCSNKRESLRHVLLECIAFKE
jgi:hypothetical protein